MAQQIVNQNEYVQIAFYFVDNGFQEAEWWQHPDDNWRNMHAPQGYFDNEAQRVQDYVAECQRIRANIEVVRNSDLFGPFIDSVDNCEHSAQINAEPNEQDKLVVVTFFGQFPNIASDLENFRGYIRRMAPTLSSRAFEAIDVNARHETLLTINNMNEIFDSLTMGRDFANEFIYEKVVQYVTDCEWPQVEWWEHPDDNNWRQEHAPQGYFDNEDQRVQEYVAECQRIRGIIEGVRNSELFEPFIDSVNNCEHSDQINEHPNEQDKLVVLRFFGQFPNIGFDLENFREYIRRMAPTLSSRAFGAIDVNARDETLLTINCMTEIFDSLTTGRGFANEFIYEEVVQYVTDCEWPQVEWWEHADDNNWRQEHAPQGYFDNEDQRVQDYVAECQRIRGIIEVVRNSDLFEPFRNSVDNCERSAQINEHPNEEDKLVVVRFFGQFPNIVSELENFREYIQGMAPTLSSRAFGAIDVNARDETLLTINNMTEIIDCVTNGKDFANQFIYEKVRQWFINRQWNVDWWEQHDNAWRVAHAPADYFANEPHTIATFANWCTNVRQRIYDIYNLVVFQEFRNSWRNIQNSIENLIPVTHEDVLALRNYFNQFPNILQDYRQEKLNLENNLRHIVPTLSSTTFTRIENLSRWIAFLTINVLHQYFNILARAHNYKQQIDQNEFDFVHQWFVDNGFEEVEWWQHPDDDWRQEHAVQGYFDNEDQHVQDYIAVCQRIRANIEEVRNSDLFDPFINSVHNCEHLAQINADPNEQDRLAVLNFFNRFPYIVSDLENLRGYIRRMAPTLSSRAFGAIDVNARDETLLTINNMNEIFNICERGRALFNTFIYQKVRQWFINRQFDVDWWQEHDNAWRVAHAPGYFANEQQTIGNFLQDCRNEIQGINDIWNSIEFQNFRNALANIRTSIANNAPVNHQDVLALRNYFNQFPNTLQEYGQVRLEFENNLRQIVPTLSFMPFRQIDIGARWLAFRTIRMLSKHIVILEYGEHYSNLIPNPANEEQNPP